MPSESYDCHQMMLGSTLPNNINENIDEVDENIFAT